MFEVDKLEDNPPLPNLDHNMCDWLLGIDFRNVLLFLR